MTQKRRTLLTHPAKLVGNVVHIENERAPEDIIVWARRTLERNGVLTAEAYRHAMSDDSENILAHDVAFALEHAVRGLALINKSPPEIRELLRTLWMHAFHAGERHESYTVNAKHLSDVVVRDSQREGRERASEATRKLTLEKYTAAVARGPKLRKQLCSWLGVSDEGLRRFERKLPHSLKWKSVKR